MTSLDHLYSIYLQHPMIDTDSRQIRRGGLFFALKGDHFDGNAFVEDALRKGSAWAVVDEPSVYGDRILKVKDTLETLQQLAALHRKKSSFQCIAITGSNGKTTTKELLRSVLARKYKTHSTRGNLNNHIGVPLTLLETRSDTEMLVLEMGANHPGEIAFLSDLAQPEYGLITTIGSAHLEGFGSSEGVYQAKTELFRYLKSNKGLAFYNKDEKQIQRGIKESKVRNVSFQKPVDEDLQVSGHYQDLCLMLDITLGSENFLAETRLFGRYNTANCFAATAIGLYFEIPMNEIVAGISAYTPENNRSQIRYGDKNTLICDAYNANPDSMRKALNEVEEINHPHTTVILGDMLETGAMEERAHEEIVTYLRAKDQWKVFLLGPRFSAIGSRYFPVFENSTSLKQYIEEKEDLKGSLILLKGSRGMALETLIPALI